MRYLGDESGYGYELDSNEPTVAELLARSMSNPVQWPKVNLTENLNFLKLYRLFTVT